MKKVTKLFIAISLLMCGYGYAQDNPDYEWKKPPKSSEIIVGEVCHPWGYDGGSAYIFETRRNGKKYGEDRDDRKQRPDESDEGIYATLLRIAQREYGEKYPKLSLRSFKMEMYENQYHTNDDLKIERKFRCSAIVVTTSPEEAANENLSNAIGKAMGRVRQGSRTAIDQITVLSSINKEEYKDQVIDILLDKGYKVVAKEYLQKLYEEQKNQQSGIYNDNTTVQGNNFSAVGYYVNIKVTETSVRVQVVNVSTGEYEGNATINF